MFLTRAGEDEKTELRSGTRRMGKYIGCLERVLLVTFVLFGYYTQRMGRITDAHGNQ